MTRNNVSRLEGLFERVAWFVASREQSNPLSSMFVPFACMLVRLSEVTGVATFARIHNFHIQHAGIDQNRVLQTHGVDAARYQLG